MLPNIHVPQCQYAAHYFSRLAFSRISVISSDYHYFGAEGHLGTDDPWPNSNFICSMCFSLTPMNNQTWKTTMYILVKCVVFDLSYLLNPSTTITSYCPANV
ncbi:hypothetical protein U1Q18_052723 [Sarracenia purpurea var. burkii]